MAVNRASMIASCAAATFVALSWITARNSPALSPKWLYSVRVETSAAAAITSILARA
jgi:hypothetical protein